VTDDLVAEGDDMATLGLEYQSFEVTLVLFTLDAKRGGEHPPDTVEVVGFRVPELIGVRHEVVSTS
jgi:hypothetical protein